MNKILKKMFALFLITLAFPFVFIANLIKEGHKEKKEEEQPDTIQTQYSDPFEGRVMIVRSINTTASAVSGFFDDVFHE